jgi:hypothetical protein
MHGLGIVGQYSENLSFEAINLEPRSQTGRTNAAFADFVHLMGCRGKIQIRNSRFVGAHDDAINVHGTYLSIVDYPAPHQLLLRFMHHQSYGFQAFFPGDKINLVRGSSLVSYASNTVKAAKFINPREILLNLDKPILEGITPGDVIENLTWTPEVEIAYNYFARIPTRGILVTTPRKVIIEHNLFERIIMSGILVSADAESWFESGSVQDITISENRFIECGNNQHPVIYIAPENKEVNVDEPIHHNILIENNYFQATSLRVLDAKSTRSLSFKRNEISLAIKRKEWITLDELIHLTACSEVVIADNSLNNYDGND